MKNNRDQWLKWAREIHALAHLSLDYEKNPFQRQNWERIKEISMEILASYGNLPTATVKDLFDCEVGYPTAKLDSRAVIVEEGKILLVKEKASGLWSLPGGFVDVNESVKSNAEKEAWEESGLRVKAIGLLAVHERHRQDKPPLAFGVIQCFVYCQVLGGEFEDNLETEASAYFSLDELPPLSLGRNTKEEIRYCLEAVKEGRWLEKVD